MNLLKQSTLILITFFSLSCFAQTEQELIEKRVNEIDSSTSKLLIFCDQGFYFGKTFKEIKDTMCVKYYLDSETKEIHKIVHEGQGTCESRFIDYFDNGKLIMRKANMTCSGQKTWDSTIYYSDDRAIYQDFKGKELNGEAFVLGAYELFEKMKKIKNCN